MNALHILSPKECVLGFSSIGITSKLVKNEAPRPHPRPMEAESAFFTRCPSDSYVPKSLRSTSLYHKKHPPKVRFNSLW